MARSRTYSEFTRQAVKLLGEQIKLERKQRQWSEQNLAERAGISRATLQKIESGDMRCAIGLVFETAALVGLPLFESDRYPINRQLVQAQEKNVLLPRRIRGATERVNDDF